MRPEEAEGAAVIRHPYNLGIGGAVQSGYKYALRGNYDVAVQVDGNEVASVELPAGSPEWRRFEFRTGSIAAEPHAVSVVLSSPDPAGRTVCFDLWTAP